MKVGGCIKSTHKCRLIRDGIQDIDLVFVFECKSLVLEGQSLSKTPYSKVEKLEIINQ